MLISSGCRSSFGLLPALLTVLRGGAYPGWTKPGRAYECGGEALGELSWDPGADRDIIRGPERVAGGGSRLMDPKVVGVDDGSKAAAAAAAATTAAAAADEAVTFALFPLRELGLVWIRE